MTVDNDLKHKITGRWKILAASVAHLDTREAAAFAQLEYILTEAGLLARPRKKRHEFGKISPNSAAHVVGATEAITAKAESDNSPTLSRSGVGDRPAIDDNSISLSEEVGRNYGE